MATHTDPTHSMSRPPPPLLPACLSHQHVDRWLACLHHELLLVILPPPKYHHTTLQQMGYFSSLVSMPRPSFTIWPTINKSRFPLAPTLGTEPRYIVTVGLEGQRGFSSSTSLKLCFTLFISLPPSSPNLVTHSLIVVTSWFFFSLCYSLSPPPLLHSVALYPRSLALASSTTFQLFWGLGSA